MLFKLIPFAALEPSLMKAVEEDLDEVFLIISLMSTDSILLKFHRLHRSFPK